MKTEGLMGGLYVITEWIMRLAVTNLLWVLFNIPLLFIGLNLLIIDSTSEAIFIYIVIMALLPFTFFPATMSMFSLHRRWIMNDVDVPIIQSFWKHYKENYLRSMSGGFILVLIWGILLIDYFYFVTNVNDQLKYFFYAIFLFLIMFTLHFFSYTVHFHTKLPESLKNSLLLTLKNPITSILISITTVLIIFISFKIVTFSVPFFMGSLISVISFLAFYKISLRGQTS